MIFTLNLQSFDDFFYQLQKKIHVKYIKTNVEEFTNQPE